jgi:kumamolisin
VAPLWAALIARCNQKLGRPVGDVHAVLYQIGTRAFRDITEGNNGAYQAGTGWDRCSRRSPRCMPDVYRASYVAPR